MFSTRSVDGLLQSMLDYLASPEARGVGAQAAKVAASAIEVVPEPQQRRRVAHHLMSS
jgi:hypothetical protein